MKVYTPAGEHLGSLAPEYRNQQDTEESMPMPHHRLSGWYIDILSFLDYSNTFYTDLNLDILIVIWSTVLYIIMNE